MSLPSPTKKGGIMKIQSSTTMLAGLSLCAGAVIGLGTGVLIAPRSGERTRRKLKDFVEDTGEHFDEKRIIAKRSISRLFKRMSFYYPNQPKNSFLSKFRVRPNRTTPYSQLRKSVLT